MTEPSLPAPISRAGSILLSDVEPFGAVSRGWEGTCVDPGPLPTGRTPRQHIAANIDLFTVGGSVARGFWADTALGARIQGSLTETGEPIELVDMCSMTCNTILGINDAWVKLRQASFLLSPRPHYLPARIGSDLLYRVAHRILRRLDAFEGAGDFVINMRQCNGSDAVELALHAAWVAAQRSPGRRTLGAFRGSYHGESVVASLIAEDDPAFGAGRALLDGVDNVEHFAAPTVGADGALDASSLATLEVLEREGDRFFAVIIEPVQWRNSVHAVPQQFLERLRDVCTRKSICLIFDEVQNAFGYTGSIFFAETSGVCPDIIATGKALTSGHGALAIVVARSEFKEIEPPFGSKTNGGEMLSLVAVDAVIDRLVGMHPHAHGALPPWLPPKLSAELGCGLLESDYARTAIALEDLLVELQGRHPSLAGSTSGLGLIRGLGMLGRDGGPSGEMAAMAADICFRHGIYVRRAGNSVYMKPSLSTSSADFAEAFERLDRTFDELTLIRDRETH